MAGKKRTKATGDKVKPKDMMKMPPEPTVRSVAADMATTRKSKGKLSETLAKIVANAKKDKGIHPAALRFVESRLAKAKASDRGLAAVATELAHIDYYLDVLGLDEMIKRPEAGETDGADDKVQKLFPAAKPAGEPDKKPAAGEPVH